MIGRRRIGCKFYCTPSIASEQKKNTQNIEMVAICITNTRRKWSSWKRYMTRIEIGRLYVGLVRCGFI